VIDPCRSWREIWAQVIGIDARAQARMLERARRRNEVVPLEVVMKRNAKKLGLSTTVIRNLTNAALDGVGGGQTKAACTTICSEGRTLCPGECLDTQFVHGCASGTR
jgi:hypothetical protein